MSEEIQRINLDDYIQTGEGGTALTYTKKDGLSLAKLSEFNYILYYQSYKSC